MSKDPMTWTAEKLSKGKYADYKFPVMVDGIGVRGSIYVSGCPFNCLGCYNKKAQNFSWGKDYTQEVEDQILKDIAQDYCEGLTLLGGEPFLNTQVLLPLAKRIKSELTGKTIWSWSGYTFEELTDSNAENWEDKLELLSYVDVLVDGRFEQDKFNPNLVFRGSWNQRIIDVQRSLEKGSVVLWEDGKYLEGEDHTPIKLFSTRK
ncbi:pyruvate formate-lyase 1-activating enzyme [Enterococcus phage GVEsP-1]|uniref:Ribonucleotide reductase of class III (Anaerobic), activating protein n=1 Tax=Enterococcus phage GVEsP-1 TaxID=2859564 RepID=A0ABX8WT86_9CAUD|nr:pyruvate formate-lyase 1-activating enzyme [Enterococcus phage GVEsP-1]